MKVAIIGIGCRFPGGITGPQDYWRVLREGRNTVGPIPSGRLDPAVLAASDVPVIPPFGGYLEEIDRLDAAFFGMSPREAERLDPQQRLLLETSWEALEDAGQPISRLRGRRGGIFVGQWLSDFESRLLADPARFDFFMTTGSGRYAASGRLSAFLGWHGPSITVDTACSSSLTAVHLAVRSIRDGDSEIALAAGVNVILEPHISMAYARSGMLAADGLCKFGDAAADGYVRSEGAAVVVLKGFERAKRDGDRIYAVIYGSAVNNDGGSSGSLGTPSKSGQEDLYERALADAGVMPHDIGYVEAHGTGTKAGDPVEIGAIGAVVGRGRKAHDRLLVGSAKTNLGHTEGAAGLAGLIKTALSVHEGTIPASLNCHAPNRAIPWDDLGCRIVTAPTPWPDTLPQIAGVSSFGISGTNAHVVLGAAHPRDLRTPCAARRNRPFILPLSARSLSGLRALAGRYRQMLSLEDAPELLDVCRNAALRRDALDCRAAFVADDVTAMTEALARYAEGEPADAEGQPGDKQIMPAFVAPGQGAQWSGMAKALLASEPVFREALERCDAAARRHVDWSIVELIADADRAETDALLQRIDVVQPTLVALSIAYARLLGAFGVRPGALTGHSMGEVAAAHLAGVISLDTAMHLICRRSALMGAASGRGAMALVEIGLEEARHRVAPYQDRLAVAAHNGPSSCVLSGDPDALDAVLGDLEKEDVFCRRIKVDVASHSPQMTSPAAKLVAELDGLDAHEPLTPIYSTAFGRRAAGHEFGPSYWGTNLTQPVLFADVVEAIASEGISTFVELGPHPVLLPSIQQTVRDAALGVCGRREEDDTRTFALLLATLWAHGTDLDWAAVLPGPDTFVRLPTYPWQRERHWYSGADLSTVPGSAKSNIRPIDDEQRSWLHRLEWKPLDLTNVDAGMRDGPWLVIGSNATADLIAARLQAAGGTVHRTALEGLAAAVKDVVGKARIIVSAGPEPDPFLPVTVLQHLGPTASPCGIWIVSEGAQSIGDEPADVAGAALWGAARVAGEERPELNIVLVDVSSGDAEAINLLADCVLGQRKEDQIVIRDRQCFGLRFTRFLEALPERERWRADAAYLVTGGLGDVGLEIASAMVDEGARRLVLLGRTPLPERSAWLSQAHSPLATRRIEAVRALEAKGASVHLACLDITDETELAGYLSRYAAEGWPPIAGVVHAAGSFANRLWPDMDRSAFNSVLGAKLHGAEVLDRLLPDAELFVLVASSGAYLPQAGQANYAAANAGLEAVAKRRQLRGRHAACIAWGVWEGTGLVADLHGQTNVSAMERQGYLALPPRRASDLFSSAAGFTKGVLVVCRMDWETYIRDRALRPTAQFAELVDCDIAGMNRSPRELARLDPKERRTRVEAIVREAVGHVLKIAPSKLVANKTLGSMGLTSLIAMELRNRLERALERPLSATLAWNYPTIEALVAHLAADEVGTSQPAAVSEPGEVIAPRADIAAIDAMSEGDVLHALAAGRARGGRR